MPILPASHAASLFKTDEAGRTLFFPQGPGAQGFAVADAAEQQRLVASLKRIRRLEIAASIVVPVLALLAIAGLAVAFDVAPGRGHVEAFVVFGVLAIAALIHVPAWMARQRLAQGLAVAPGHTAKLTWSDRLPKWSIWVLALSAVTVVGLGLYLGMVGLVWAPVRGLRLLELVAEGVLAAKLAKAVAIGGAIVGAIWLGMARIRRWLRHD